MVCPTAGGRDVVLGTITCTPSTNIGPTGVYASRRPIWASCSRCRDAGQPNGTTTQFLIPNIGAAAQYTGLYSRTPTVTVGDSAACRKRSAAAMPISTSRATSSPALCRQCRMRYVHTLQKRPA